ncbi:MAG: cyclic pyranopterin monophosphate synthase MoaC [Gallicola sp.]|nr:cyclic pyranopterin monophosphate synthase MoaC [Gallicola sp.]
MSENNLGFTHFNDEGRAKMVDVSKKDRTKRSATASATVILNENTYKKILNKEMKKGDVLQVAQIAGIMAAKKTSEFIPMCHPIMITGVDMDFKMDDENFEIKILGTVKCVGETGVEMEALTAVSTAALTIYDMCKAIQKDIEITNIYLVEKLGGKSGVYHRGDK